MRDEVAAKNYVYHFDHQGTTQCLTNEQGVVTDRFAADAWGVQVTRTGTCINRHWYIGRGGYHRNKAPSSDYVRARWYAQAAGRWMSLEPRSRATRLFRYAANMPATRHDPTGLRSVTCTPVEFR